LADAADAGLLGGLSPAAFLRRHWQKEARLVRGAVPGFAGLFDRRALVALACRDDVESRLVVRDGRRWSLAHGPFRARDFATLPARDWTLLVQGVNVHSRKADALLRRFDFVPYARLDDLMVSYAVQGGGVGPHVDSYDVFLLQGFGRRRWRYGRASDLALRKGLPLRILRRFAPTNDDVLSAGDMLYLPPQYAHDGVALDECTTYSIGFRAPAAQELATAFLDYLRDRVVLEGRYADPDLAPASEPARIDARMQRRVAAMLRGIRWDAATVAHFLGCMMSDPKDHVIFARPRAPLSRTAFARRVATHGIELDPRTLLLYDERRVYANGDALMLEGIDAASLRALANGRALDARRCASLDPSTMELLHAWYRDGYLAPGS